MKQIIAHSTSWILAGSFMLFSAGVYANNNMTGPGPKALKQEKKQEKKEEKKEERKEKRQFRKAEDMNDVSDFTKKQFLIDFPNATNVQYVKTKSFDEVSFTNGKKREKAFYDASASLVGTTQVKKFTDLPAAAQKEIPKKYPGYQVVRVIKFDDNEANSTDMMLYGLSFEDADSYFVEMKKDTKAIVLNVDMAGAVSFFTDMK